MLSMAQLMFIANMPTIVLPSINGTGPINGNRQRAYHWLANEYRHWSN